METAANHCRSFQDKQELSNQGFTHGTVRGTFVVQQGALVYLFGQAQGMSKCVGSGLLKDGWFQVNQCSDVVLADTLHSGQTWGKTIHSMIRDHDIVYASIGSNGIARCPFAFDNMAACTMHPVLTNEIVTSIALPDYGAFAYVVTNSGIVRCPYTRRQGVYGQQGAVGSQLDVASCQMHQTLPFTATSLVIRKGETEDYILMSTTTGTFEKCT